MLTSGFVLLGSHFFCDLLRSCTAFFSFFFTNRWQQKKILGKLSCSIYWLPRQRLNALDALFALFFSCISIALCSVFSYIQACSPKLILPHISKCLLLHLETILLLNLSKVHSFVRSNVSTIFSNFQNSLMIWLSLCRRWKDIFNWKKYFFTN